MIIYNIRANGPYEYDKMMLNYGQLHNLYKKLEKTWETSNIQALNNKLTKIIQENTGDNSKLNDLAMLNRTIVE